MVDRLLPPGGGLLLTLAVMVPFWLGVAGCASTTGNIKASNGSCVIVKSDDSIIISGNCHLALDTPNPQTPIHVEPAPIKGLEIGRGVLWDAQNNSVIDVMPNTITEADYSDILKRAGIE